jgi:hypothetical protein
VANQLYDEYAERGMVFIHVIIDDSPDAGTTVDWTDAQYWAYSMDFDSDATVDKLKILAIADTDGGLWARYVDNCSDLSGTNKLLCQLSCQVTPQTQIFDQGGLTIDDPCARPVGQVQCAGCGLDENHVRGVLDATLPAEVCGEAVSVTP